MPTANARHVREADEAVRLGPAAARESYLKVDAVLDAAKRTGAGAIHPGYGFLSENADFVEALAPRPASSWIGPPASAIGRWAPSPPPRRAWPRPACRWCRATTATTRTRRPCAAEAEQIGYPVLLKASAGGGGKGMRVVEARDGFADQLDGCPSASPRPPSATSAC